MTYVIFLFHCHLWKTFTINICFEYGVESNAAKIAWSLFLNYLAMTSTFEQLNFRSSAFTIRVYTLGISNFIFKIGYHLDDSRRANFL